MAKKQKTNKKKWLVRLLFLCLFVGAIVVTYFVWDAYFQDKPKGESSGQQGQSIDVKEPEKEQSKDESNKQNEEKNDFPQKVEQYEGEDPNVADSITGAVTYAGTNGDRLVIRVNIDQYLDDGECRLALWNGANMVHEEVTGVIDNASTATCDGFDIPVGILPGENFDIIIDIESGGKKGTVKGNVDIRSVVN